MASRPMEFIEGKNCVWAAPLVGLPPDERREWLTRVLAAAELALDDHLRSPSSPERETMIEDICDLRDRLKDELALLGM
jgi:hypothetical protein